MNESIPVIRYCEDHSTHHDGLPSITDLPCIPLAQATKEKVCDYMLHSDFRNKDFVFLCGPDHDAFTGESICACGRFYDDGKWFWYDDLPVYFYKYDISLPDEFIEDVLSFYDNGGVPDPYLHVYERY